MAFSLPSVTYVYPTLNDSATVVSGWVFVNVTSSEPLNLSLLEWGNSSGYSNLSMLNSSQTNWYLNMTGLSDGTYNYTVWAQNLTGAWNQSARRLVSVDAVSPYLLYSCQNLTVAGGVYLLAQNVSSPGTCFEILANGITLDGQGFTVNYSQSLVGYGVNVTSRDNVTIRNLNLVQGNASVTSAFAIIASGMGYSIMTNNNITTSSGLSRGISLESSSTSNNVSYNVIKGTSEYGLMLDTSSGSNYVYNNTINVSSTYGLAVKTDSNVISNNYVRSTANIALIIWGSGYNIFTDNTVEGGTTSAYYVFGPTPGNNISGGTVTGIGSDYLVRGGATTSTFRNTGFTGSKKITFLIDSDSWFNHNNETNGNVWLRTNAPAGNVLTRTLATWSRPTMRWNDSASVNANYSLTGLFPNATYHVYNASGGVPTTAYTLTTGPAGAMNFTLSLNGNTEITVADDIPPPLSVNYPLDGLALTSKTPALNVTSSAESVWYRIDGGYNGTYGCSPAGCSVDLTSLWVSGSGGDGWGNVTLNGTKLVNNSARLRYGWESNNSWFAGLGAAGFPTPDIYDVNNDGMPDLVMGERYGSFTGYSWNGSQWASNSNVSRGLNDTGSGDYDRSDSAIYDIDGDGLPELISLGQYGTYNKTGYEWNGTGWYVNNSLVGGLTDSYENFPEIVDLFNNGIPDLIVGEDYGAFDGYSWNGTGWFQNSSLVAGLPVLAGYAQPAIYDIDGNAALDLVAFQQWAAYSIYGYTWNGSQWVSNSNLVIGLSPIDHPQIYDVNNDSLPDMVMGNSAGYSFYKAVSGNLTSTIKDSGAGTAWLQIKFEGAVPAGTAVDIYVNTSSDNGGADPYSGYVLVTSNASAGVFYALPSGSRERYAGWLVALRTNDSAFTPAVLSVTLGASLSDGLHALAVFANDSAGNLNSGSVLFTVDPAGPVISLIGPTSPNNSYVPGWSLVNASVSDSFNATSFIDWNGSLVGWWRFNREAGENGTFFRDWSAYGNNASCSGCPVAAAGRFGYALLFDGADDGLVVPDSAYLDLPGPFTLEGWFRPSGAISGGSGQDQVLLDKGSYRFLLDGSDGKLRFFMDSGSPKNWSAVSSGLNGFAYSITPWNGDLYAGGTFTSAGGFSANYVAKWDGSGWSAVGLGMDNNVWALAVWNGSLYAAGEFASADILPANRTARWDGNSWAALGSGVNGKVEALAVWNGSLYAGGEFTSAGGVAASRIARWDGAAWGPVGSGFDGAVKSLAVWNGSLYAGGAFTSAGGVGANRTAVWDGSGWSALGSGTGGTVESIAVWNGSLYAGGSFTSAGGVPANYTAVWNGSGWGRMGSGVDNSVEALAVWNGVLYAGGLFTVADGLSVNYIARWNGTSWVAAGSGMNDQVDSLAVWAGSLYAGGWFASAGGVSANRIARLSGGDEVVIGSSSGSWGAGWHHFAVSYGNSSLRLYADGGLEKNVSANISVAPTQFPLLVGGTYGSSHGGGVEQFNGAIDELRFHSRALSAGEILASHDAALNGLYGDFRGLTGGSYGYVAYAQDVAGTLNATGRMFLSSDPVAPSVFFTFPTDNGTSYVRRPWAFVNVSVSDSYNTTAFIDWNRSFVGWWRFNREAGENSTFFRDWSSWGNNGTGIDSNVSNPDGYSPPLAVSGKFGSALSFDGSDDYLAVANVSGLGGGAFTLEAWVYPAGGGWGSVLGRSNSSSANGGAGFILNANVSGNLQFYLYNSTGSGTQAVRPMGAGAWQHVVGVYNQTHLVAYVNGVPGSATEAGGYLPDTVNGLAIGRYSYADGGHFNGTIDEVRIWNRALSPQEINASFNAGSYRLYRNFTGLQGGAYSYVAYSQDMAGNINSTDARAVVVDTVPPSISVQSPNATTYPPAPIRLNYTAYDLSGVDSCYYELTNSSGSFNMVLPGCQNATLSGVSGGSNVVRVWANDTFGNWNASSPVSFVMDASGPSVSVQSPLHTGTYNSNNVTLNFTAWDSAGVSQCLYEMNGSNTSLPSCANTTLFGLAEGGHTLKVWANDTFNNWGVSGTVSFNVDTLGPVAYVQSPSLGVTYASASVGLNYTAVAPLGVSQCRYELDGAPNVSLPSCVNTTLSGLSQGGHSVRVWVNDSFNNWGVSAVVSFTVDTAGPAISVQSPSNGTYYTSGVGLNYTAWDPSGLSLCKYELDGGANQSLPGCGNSSLSGLSDGGHKVKVWANDSVGNWNVSATVSFSVDTGAPVVSVQSPGGGLTYSSSSVGLNYTAGAPSGISQCKYELDGAANVSLPSCVNSTLSGLSQGGHSVRVWANDSLGVWGVSATVSFSVDTLGPAISVQSPAGSNYTSTSVSLNYTAGDPSGLSQCKYELDGSNTTIGLCVNSTLAGLGQGGHALKLWANDSVGNWNSSAFVYFTVDSLGPSISVQSPSNGTYGSGNVSLNYTAGDPSGVSNCGYELDGAPNVSLPSCGNATLAGLADGGHYLKVWANDTLGRWGGSGTVSFAVDSAGPSISIHSPVGRAYASAQVLLNFTLFDGSGVGSCWYELVNSSGSYNLSLPSCSNYALAGVSEGSNLVRVWANDTLGNLNVSGFVPFSLDTIPPSLSFSGQTPFGAVVNDSYAFINVSSSEGLSSAVLAWNGTNFTMSGSGSNWYLNRTGLFRGNFSFRVFGNDSAGNWNSTGQAWVYVNVTVFYPFNFSLFNSTGGPVANATLSLYNASGGNASIFALNGSELLSLEGGLSYRAVLGLPSGFSVGLEDVFAGGGANVSLTYVQQYPGALPDYTSAVSPLFFLNASGLVFSYGEVGLPLSGSANRILYCSGWNQSCPSWASNSTYSYNASEANSSLAFNVSSLGAYLAAYYYVPPPPPPSSGGGGPSPAAVAAPSSVRSFSSSPPAPLVRIAVGLNREIKGPSLVLGRGVPVVGPSGIVYHYFNVSALGFVSSDVANATFEFRVNRSWIAGNDISSVYLARYSSSGWGRLRTELLNSTSTSRSYRSYSPGLSYFAIVGEKAAALPPEPEVPVGEPAMINVSSNESTAPAPALLTEEDILKVIRLADSTRPQTGRARELLALSRLKIEEARDAFGAGEQRSAKASLDDARGMLAEAAALRAVSVAGEKQAIFRAMLLILSVFGYAYLPDLLKRVKRDIAAGRLALVPLAAAGAFLLVGAYFFYLAMSSASPLAAAKLGVLGVILLLAAAVIGLYENSRRRAA